MNIVTVKEIATLFKLTPATIYHLADTGEIPAMKIGKSWRFDMDEVMKKFNLNGKNKSIESHSG